MPTRTFPVSVAWQTASPRLYQERNFAMGAGEDVIFAFTVYDDPEADEPMDVSDVSARLILFDPHTGLRYVEAASSTVDAEAGRLNIPLSRGVTEGLGGVYGVQVEFTTTGAINTLCRGVVNIEGLLAGVAPLPDYGSGTPQLDGTVAHGLVDDGEIEIDWTVASTHTLTLGSETTALSLAIIPGHTGMRAVIVRVEQDDTGNRYMTFPDNILWQGGYAPSLSTAPGAADTIQFITWNQGITWDAAITMQVEPPP